MFLRVALFALPLFGDFPGDEMIITTAFTRESSDVSNVARQTALFVEAGAREAVQYMASQEEDDHTNQGN